MWAQLQTKINAPAGLPDGLMNGSKTTCGSAPATAVAPRFAVTQFLRAVLLPTIAPVVELKNSTACPETHIVMFTEEGAVAHEKSGRSAKNGVFEPLQATPKVDVQVPAVVGNAMFWTGACAEETTAVATSSMNGPRMTMGSFITIVSGGIFVGVPIAQHYNAFGGFQRTVLLLRQRGRGMAKRKRPQVFT